MSILRRKSQVEFPFGPEIIETPPFAFPPDFNPDEKPLRLILTLLGDNEWRAEVSLRGTVTIGRSCSNKVVVSHDMTVFPHHCEIFQEDGSCWVRDVGSKKGTFVDGVKVRYDKRVQLRSGSLLRLGNLEFRVEIQKE